MAGRRDKLKGTVKEATGILIGDKALEREGKFDKAVGSVKEAAEKIVNKVRDAVTPKRTLKQRAQKAAKSLR
jgi:uncharacterized protein YjbJ (UPF0337 family)